MLFQFQFSHREPDYVRMGSGGGINMMHTFACKGARGLNHSQGRRMHLGGPGLGGQALRGHFPNRKGHLKIFSGYITFFPKYGKIFPDIPKYFPDISYFSGNEQNFPENNINSSFQNLGGLVPPIPTPLTIRTFVF